MNHLRLVIVQPIEHMFPLEVLHREQRRVEGYPHLVKDYNQRRTVIATYCRIRNASLNLKPGFP